MKQSCPILFIEQKNEVEKQGKTLKSDKASCMAREALKFWQMCGIKWITYDIHKCYIELKIKLVGSNISTLWLY